MRPHPKCYTSRVDSALTDVLFCVGVFSLLFRSAWWALRQCNAFRQVSIIGQQADNKPQCFLNI